MGILSASTDQLKYDKLKDDELNSYDPLNKGAGKVVAEYQKDLGFPTMPGEREVVDEFKSAVDSTVAGQTSALAKFKDSYQKATDQAQAKANGILADQANSFPGQQTITIQITGNGQVESTYVVNKEWAEANMPELNQKSNGMYNPIKMANGVWTVDAAGYGKELAALMKSAQDETYKAGQTIDLARGKQLDATQYAIDKAMGTAEDFYNFEVEKATMIITQTKELWTGFVKDRIKEFEKAKETNTAGISDLISSGVLITSGATE